MARRGHIRSRAPRPVTRVAYEPPSTYPYDIEVLTSTEMGQRVARSGAPRIERIDFHVLLYVAAGRYHHMVDFETLACGPGTMLTLQPGQVHRFGDATAWTGWALIFRSEEVWGAGSPDPALRALEASHVLARTPTIVACEGTTRLAMAQALAQMAEDARRAAPVTLVRVLLRRQLEALLLRLALARPGRAVAPARDPAVRARFHRFEALLEREYRRWHGAARYAAALGCSEKALVRTTRAMVDRTAKELVVARLVLEARRLLVHTSAPVAAIAEDLGFDEATNFVKFFRREAGETPGAFRVRHGSGHVPGARSLAPRGSARRGPRGRARGL